ncbi:MAG: hypothetical protein KQJ78_16995 [Deltaproteobacteria bacterium]|nr:hypothetical protein [Deltaproteobacteria bacterium]
MGAWWLGTACLAVFSVLTGELTLGVSCRLNARFAKDVADKMVGWHNVSVRALKAGDKESYRAANTEANEAFGRVFFLQVAMSAASLWPAFAAAAWLRWRFGELPIPVPFTPWAVPWPAGFVACYLAARVGWSKFKAKVPFFGRWTKVAKELSPSETMEFFDQEAGPGGAHQNKVKEKN